MFTTDQKGAVAELAIAHAAAELGVGVFKPLTDGERFVPASRLEGHFQLILRLAPSHNQTRGINWADDFDCGARLKALLGP